MFNIAKKKIFILKRKTNNNNKIKILKDNKIIKKTNMIKIKQKK
jgi:hypothetical protein